MIIGNKQFKKVLCKGFTLIELLAVIIVLAIIALIATPSIINVINSAKDKSDLESVHGILDSARLYYSESMINSDSRSDIENLNNIYEKVGLSVKEKAGELYINEKGLSAIAIVIRNKCYTKQFTGDIKITENIDNCTLGYVGIDTTAPTVTFNVEDGVFNSNGWAKSNFNVNITISDSESGPNSYKYCIDTKNCEPVVLVNNVTGFSEINNNSETNKVCVIGIDNYGNESDAICSDDYKLDSVVPTLTAISNNVTITEGNSNLVSSYFNTPSYGISGGSLSCSPTNTSGLSVGTQAVSCTATSNSGLFITTNKNITVEKSIYIVSKGVNAPQLTSGMTPIKWNGTTEVTTTSDDTDWYDYNNKKWANAKTADGSYWVWIPRYAYKITSGWHSNTTGTIDIKFLKNDTTENSSGTTIYTSGYSTTGTNTSNAYFLEPAFQNSTGDTKYGFWVAKFDMSNTTTLPKSVPNQYALNVKISVGDKFNYAKNMANNITYGWSIGSVETHMMTNYEWGAVAYLSQSSYGKNSEIWVNNSWNVIAGCAGSSVSAEQYSGCQYSYNTANGMQASTTGNITGIYDMSGGATKYTAAYVNNGDDNLSNGSSIVNSTINKNVYSASSSESTLNNYNLNKNIYGDAIYETSSTSDYESGKSWYSDEAYMASGISPWFTRGGYDGWTSRTHIGIFSFECLSGLPETGTSFRTIIGIK